MRSIKWYFSMRRNICIRIMDGGCGRSLNRFDSRSACEKTCKRLISPQAVLSTKIPLAFTKPDSITHPTSSLARRTRQIQNIGSTFGRKRVLRKSPEDRPESSPKSSPVLPRRTTAPKYSSPADSEIGIITDNFRVSYCDNSYSDFDPCLQVPIKGSCDYGFRRKPYQMSRYSFQIETGRCHKVNFSGCKSGENLFDDANDCRSSCQFRLHQSLREFHGKILLFWSMSYRSLSQFSFP